MHLRPMNCSNEEPSLSQGGNEPAGRASAAAHDPLNDVFGSDGIRDDAVAPESTHPSDMSRLQTEHSTSGYREGVAVAKEASIQSGFDEGFSIGATIGLEAGRLLGIIEGIYDAVKSSNNSQSSVCEALLEEARKDLSTNNIFSPEYWAPDGTWTYNVPAQGDTEILFPDVAKAHPLIRKWKATVDKQMQDWDIQQTILDDESGPRMDLLSEEPTISGPVQRTVNKGLEW